MASHTSDRNIFGPHRRKRARSRSPPPATGPRALDDAAAPDTEGITAAAVHLASPTRIYIDWHSGIRRAYTTASGHRGESHLHVLITEAWSSRPLVTVQDAASHTLAHNPKVAGSNPAPATKKTRSEAISDLVLSRPCNRSATRCNPASPTGPSNERRSGRCG